MSSNKKITPSATPPNFPVGESRTVAGKLEGFRNSIKNLIKNPQTDQKQTLRKIMTLVRENFTTGSRLPSKITNTDCVLAAEKVLLSKFTPASVVVDKHLNIVRSQGAIAPYLSPPSEHSTNLLQIARPGLAFDLENTLKIVSETGLSSGKENIPVDIDGKISMISFEILPLGDITDRHYLIVLSPSVPINSDGRKSTLGQTTSELLKANAELKASIHNSRQAIIQLQQYAYVASHDLQEPLRKILMFTSRLEEFHDELPRDAVVLLEKIGVASSRMKTLIKDLLEYSYLDNNQEQFVMTNLNTIFNNILADFELSIEEKSAEIKISALPTIMAIPLQMNQLFYNLVSNSLKFCSPDRVPLLTITSRKLDSEAVEGYPSLDPKGIYEEIIFSDNGIGFEQEYEHQIFTIFQRLHSNEVYTGTGIGLATAKKIMENHHGEIFAKAEKGKGASFHIILPLGATMNE
jgi:signal transduction histidine kinase